MNLIVMTMGTTQPNDQHHLNTQQPTCHSARGSVALALALSPDPIAARDYMDFDVWLVHEAPLYCGESWQDLAKVVAV